MPVSSAMAMNSDGGTAPQPSGHRASASMPPISPVARLTIGW